MSPSFESPSFEPPGFEIRTYASLGSTNDEARRLAREGAAEGTVVTALEQTAGRGRHGRGWASPPGNLYLSLLLRPNLPPGRLGELAFLAGLAVAETVAALLPAGRAVTLKWPNDVLVDGAKTAGILIEQEAEAAVIGIGLNLAHCPADTPYPATTLAAAGAETGVAAARACLLDRLAAALVRWRGEGFAPIRSAWLARAHPLGAALSVRLPEGAITGRFAGLDPGGALLIETVDGPRRITSGEVLR